MSTRNVTLKDFPQLYSFWEQSGLWIYPYEEERTRFVSMYRLHPDFLFVICHKDEIIGSILGAFDGRTLSIHRFAIHQDYRKHGYGSMLITLLEKTAKQKGVLRIAGQIHENNSSVLSFYEKLGYKRDDTIDITKKIE